MPSGVYSRTLTSLAFAAAVAVAGAASAGDGSVRPNYTFGDGATGFALNTHGASVSPTIFVNFSALADPAAELGAEALNSYKPAFLDITDGTSPTFYNEGGAGFVFQFYHSFGDGSVRPLDVPNSDGFTSFRHVEGDHVIDILFHFGGGVVDPGSWVGFNPQPDPPGDGISQAFSFRSADAAPTGAAFGPLDRGRTDAFVTFSMTIDGAPITFSAAPEPSSWAIMLLGFGGAGAVLRRRRARLAAA
jgi:hypothetical protein